MAVGNIDQLSRVRDLTIGTRREGPQIILGYGDVGKRVATVQAYCGIRPLIVDRRDLGDIGFQQIIGDATTEASLMEAGIKEAVSILIMLNQDSDAIYATLLAKNLNPDAFVVVRANRLKSAGEDLPGRGRLCGIRTHRRQPYARQDHPGRRGGAGSAL